MSPYYSKTIASAHAKASLSSVFPFCPPLVKVLVIVMLLYARHYPPLVWYQLSAGDKSLPAGCLFWEVMSWSRIGALEEERTSIQEYTANRRLDGQLGLSTALSHWRTLQMCRRIILKGRERSTYLPAPESLLVKDFSRRLSPCICMFIHMHCGFPQTSQA